MDTSLCIFAFKPKNNIRLFEFHTLYSIKNNDAQARIHFQDVVNNYPNSNKRPDALLKLGIIFQKENNFEKAKELLNITNMAMSEIAYKIGFKDPLYFTRFFKNKIGVSPTAFRKKSI